MSYSSARRLAAASCVLALISANAMAQDSTNQYEYSKLIKSAEAVGTLGPDMFGDQVNLYTGSLSFSVTDVSLPGNFALPVAVGRSFTAQDLVIAGRYGAFADWDLEIPHMSATFVKGLGWQVDRPGNRDARCTVPDVTQAAAPILTMNPGILFPDSYWHGFMLHQPGGGSQTLLHNGGFNPRPPGTGYYWSTNNNWKVTCLSATANVGVPVPGEAFLATAPDGTTYRFDWFAKRPVVGVYVSTDSGGALMAGAPEGEVQAAGSTGLTEATGSSSAASSAGVTVYKEREEILIYPTLVTDRFGNTVEYTYDQAKPERLKKILSSDGRQIDLTHDGVTGFVTTVSDGTRTWTYNYTGTALSSVTQPDGTQWVLGMGNLDNYHITYSTLAPCTNQGKGTGGTTTATITHPSGAIGEFKVSAIQHGRSYVLGKCSSEWSGGMLRNPINFTTVGITSKKISGPGISTPATWTYTYGPANASWDADCAAGCLATKSVSVTGPTDFVRYTFGNKSLYNEGKLLTVERGGSSTNILSTETTTYQLDPTNQTYLQNLGALIPDRTDDTSYKYSPEVQRTLVQDGVTFTWKVNSTGGVYSYDTFALPLAITRSSTGGAGGNFSRGETTAYHHNASKWVIGQVASVTDAATSKVMSQTTFDTTTALPLTASKFGVLQQTLTYDLITVGSKGALASVKDGRNKVTTLGSWHRGVPRAIGYPNGESEGATVNPIGTIATTTDEPGFSHAYGYDTTGRLASVTYPSGDTTSWNGTTRSFTKLTAAAYGVQAGQWKQVVATGDAQAKGQLTTFYDAQWRPVLVLTEDTGNSSSKSFVVHRYDAAGRETFVSYPVGSLTSVDDALKGASIQYDALGRVTALLQDAEAPHSVLTTTTEYLSGFQTRVTNPRGYKTTTSFQLFDEPSTDSPVGIVSGVGLPEQQTTTIVRDGFGKPLSITRSGTGG